MAWQRSELIAGHQDLILPLSLFSSFPSQPLLFSLFCSTLAWCTAGTAASCRLVSKLTGSLHWPFDLRVSSCQNKPVGCLITEIITDAWCSISTHPPGTPSTSSGKGACMENEGTRQGWSSRAGQEPIQQRTGSELRALLLQWASHTHVPGARQVCTWAYSSGA